ncbi:TylF/MycF/NovP-related O-methyltransferase [Magnetospirillum sulfuroxidans]|uniref:Class I SAM-dependent methyltransferase n=1 Tax=Magnetospirillum sulfuroxidans TaxID=611300 RepID=A0ABS5IH29_9PROT|nr:TylF/MycF/NovP-related O-methyltransferase [Magnetospirillum sulfuroxidans]MBR9973739.1 class I SAM-dependent methyltransferase [Magnetospirillum sulfuroxidans]
MDTFAEETRFFQWCDPSRVGKFLAHAKLYEMSLGLPGAFLEVGVFKGASFCRFRKLARLFHPDHTRRFLGFDTFGAFPDADNPADEAKRKNFIETAGEFSIGREALMDMLAEQNLQQNVMLVAGDITTTLPDFFEENGAVSVAIANIDVDLYKPTKAALESIFPRLVRGGILILDDYEGFPGARQAVNEFLAENNRPEQVRKMSVSASPCYLVKEA